VRTIVTNKLIVNIKFPQIIGKSLFFLFFVTIFLVERIFGKS